MTDTVGSPVSVTLDGVTFDLVGDANFSQMKGKYTNEEIVTSGKIIQKKTLRAQKTESVNIQANGEEAELLKQLSERIENYPISYELAGGDIFKAVGFINFESHDTEAGVAVIQMTPEDNDGWAPFLS